MILSTTNLNVILLITALIFGLSKTAFAEVTLETEVKISDIGLHFDGDDLDFGNVNTRNANLNEQYDFFFGNKISAHGDAVKTYKHYVFMTWYKGGKSERNVMLSRYNTITGSVVTIEFPHRHTGFRGDPLVGESHNTIGLAVSPINGTIHMVYDMHAYTNSNHDKKFENDFFRYSYSVEGAADVPDNQFNLSQFVKDTSSIKQGNNDYKHLTMTGNLSDRNNFSALTYPQFFTNTDGTLLLYMRLGGNNNGAYVFNSYDAANQTWSKFTKFNHNNQRSRGNAYNWGLYGNMKYVNGKLRVGFQQRSSNNNDKYLFQNGVFYAFSNDPEGKGQWKNHQGQNMTFPLVNSDEIKVFEPGDYITHTERNSVYIVGAFDWTVTARGDIHIISRVRSTNRNRPDYEEVSIHSYKPIGSTEFIHSTEFVGASEIYTAGDDIYIIGLRGGKPFVEKALGGTNNFTRVYEQSGGRTFDHGVIHIANGKVYFYLMEKTSGSAMPLHLQIIDLDIDGSSNNNQSPVVTFPVSSVTRDEGYTNLSFNIAASSPNNGVDIDNVKLFVNGNFIRQENVAPYEWGHAAKPNELLGMPVGEHVITAIATDENGIEGEASIMLTVTDTTGECTSVSDIPWNTRMAVSLATTDGKSCIRFDRSLSGHTVQFWDSDTNTSCNFRGTASSVDGVGSITIADDYKQSSDYTGRTLKLNPSNGCRFLEVRGR